MGSSGGGDVPKEREMRFAPYLESAHKDFLDAGGTSSDPTLTLYTAFNNSVNGSVYSDFSDVVPAEGFFGYKADGTTLYSVEDFPSLYDMFGKFMAGLDVETLWTQMAQTITYGSELDSAVSAQSALLQDDIDTTVLPKFKAGMRNINAVQSSAFINGQAIIQTAHTKALNKFAGDLRVEALKISTQAWIKHLDWNQAVISVYADLTKLFYVAEMDADTHNYGFAAKDQLWNLNLFNYVIAMLGALSGNPGVASGGGNEPSGIQKALGGAMSGAATGSMIAQSVGAISGPVGMAAGAAIGLGGSLL